jgi:hypothetical protein
VCLVALACEVACAVGDQAYPPRPSVAPRPSRQFVRSVARAAQLGRDKP